MTVLRNRDYRLYYGGLLFSVSGYQMMLFTLGWLAFRVTGDVLALGLVAGAQAVPSLIFNLFGGALADRLNQRYLIMVGEAVAAVMIAALAVLTLFADVQLWHIMVATFLSSVALGIDAPARRVIWAYLVPKDEYAYAISLNQMVWNSTRIYAPGLAGALIAVVDRLSDIANFGIGISLFVTAASFMAMAATMVLVRMGPVERSTGKNVLHDVLDGLRFSWRNSIFAYLLGLSFVVGFFGLSFAILMPVFVVDYLDGGAGSVGALVSAVGVGGLVGTIGIASFARYQSSPWVLIGGAASSGVAVIAFAAAAALTGSFWLTMLVAGLIGFTFAFFTIANGTATNLLVPDNFRGRVLSLRSITYSLAPLGGLALAAIAVFTGTAVAVALGGGVLAIAAVGAYVMSPDIRSLPELVAGGAVTDAETVSV